MKASLFANLVAGSTAALVPAPISRRQDDPAGVTSADFLLINSTITDILALVQNLDTAVLEWKSGTDIKVVTDAADAIVTRAEGAIPAINATVGLSNDTEILDIATLVGVNLEDGSRMVVRDLEARKPDIQSNNLCETAYNSSVEIYNAARDLGNAISPKILDPLYAPIAPELIAELLGIIEEAQLAFQPSNCTNTGPTSTSTSTVTSTTSTTLTTTSSVTTTLTGVASYGGSKPSSSIISSSYGAVIYPSSHPLGPATSTSCGSYGNASPSGQYPGQKPPSGTYPTGTSGGHGSSGGSGSYGGSGSFPVKPSGSYPAGTVPYTGGASKLAPAGALLLAVAVLFV